MTITESAAAQLPAHGRRKRSKKYWTDAENEVLKETYPVGGAVYASSRLPGRTPKACQVQAKRLNFKIGEIRESDGRIRDAGQTHTRSFGLQNTRPDRTFLPRLGHPLIESRKSLWQHMVVAAKNAPRALIEGKNNRKIGGKILKGPWLGFPVYTLTLEERATCPTSCRMWRSCYGNGMNFARRLMPGPDLEHAVYRDLVGIAKKYPLGFAVRLHVLGDFYSPEYVLFWSDMLQHFPMLRVFGFTARCDEGDPIARGLRLLVQEHWKDDDPDPRFAIRFSNASRMDRSTASIEHPLQKPDDAVICPNQLGETDSCSSCGLCWHSIRRIAFIQH